jgi:hypothetical protein
MASITSVISFFILLLATYSCSAPIGTSTSEYEYSTGQTIFKHGHANHIHYDDESTDVTHTHQDRSSEEYNSEEVTKRSATLSYPDSSSEEKYPVRSMDDYLMSTMESSTEFNRRAIRPVEFQEEIETSTSYFSESPIEMTTNVELSSSVNSFGKFTGLLHDNQVEEQSTTPEYENVDQTTEEPTTVETQKLTQTVSIIPGKITETKIYANVPTKTSVFIQPVEEKQLSQGQKQ